LTPLSNSCAFCDLIFASPVGRQRCEASWARLADSDRAARIEVCHAGLSYARGRIQVGDEFVGMLFAGQFVADEPARHALEVDEIAQRCDIPAADLRRAAAEIRIVEPARADWLLKLLQKVAETFSHIGEQRLDLLQRLRQVAQLAKV
jgi:ligand-binding sensor protein